ncbi:hybrid sensor histidine kinase/response regulator [Geoanaerobacter pelophilus]|nr:ATP-binding protein [Geoanaerobacter pelophilus]
MPQRAPDSERSGVSQSKSRSLGLWLSPLLMLGALLLVFALIVWFVEGNDQKSKQSDLSARAKTISGTAQLTLEGNESYLTLLALERATGKLNQSLFQQRASRYIHEHPEMINITWVDADLYIRDVSPLAQNQQILGLHVDLPEPKRASRLAKDLRLPVYTRPFQAIQGVTSFEIWVPVYRDDTFLGLFAGVYSCDKLLQQLIWQVRPRSYHLSLVDGRGSILASYPAEKDLDQNLFKEIRITPEDSGVTLRIDRYETGSEWRLVILKLLSLVLVVGLGYALWNLKREMDERRRVEEALKEQAKTLEQEVRERKAAQEHLQDQAVLLEEQIDERWQAEEALRASEERLRLLLDSTGEAIYGIDLDGNCTFCNRACVRMLGGDSPDQYLGQNMHDIIHHSYPDGTPMPRSSCMVHQTLQEEQGSHVNDEVFWRADGSSFPVEYWSHPQVKEGKVIGAVVAFIDISDRKRLEEQYRQSQKMESVGRLAGGVAHDFNNMLSVIVGAAELGKRKLEEGEPIEPYLEVITNAAKRSSDITRQLLAFSRKEVISPRPVDLNQLIRESNKILARLISEDVELVFRPDQGLWAVSIDPSQVDQILMNLAVNARDAMPNGGRLTIETRNLQLSGDCSHVHPDAHQGDYVQLSVSDTGEGMDRSTIEHIFEPFFTTKELGKGTGLGLATVYGIVKQNKGFINVYSEPGHGSVFRIHLPRLADPNALGAAPESSAPSLSGTVLLVEDEEMLLWLATQLLEELGFSVIQAQGPREAIAICEDLGRNIDLILTDVVMPEMNGREMVEKIREKRPEQKVLFMSGYTSDHVVQRGILEQGMQYIPKPLDMRSLGEKIAEVLAGK